MRFQSLGFAAAIVCAALLSAGNASGAGVCEMATFGDIDLSEAAATITAVTAVAATETLPAYCKVCVTHAMPFDIAPGDADIDTEIWLPPPSAWNGKYLGTGNGGCAPAMRADILGLGIIMGYASANTTMGTHSAGRNGLDFRFGMETEGADAGQTHPERWHNFGYRATHLMTLAAKQVIRTFYGQAQRRAYFIGCSTGGQQGLMEAQRYPLDYDGIVAGGSALNRTRLHMHGLWTYRANHLFPGSYIPQEKWDLITQAARAACDPLDGVTDGLIDDPRECDFDGTALLCRPDQDPATCLAPAQLLTLHTIWAGAHNPVTGGRIYTGLTKGAEWFPNYGPAIYPAAFAGTPAPSVPLLNVSALLEWGLGSTFDVTAFDWDADVAAVDATLAEILNADDPDLGAFRAGGGKLILFHGWADPLVFSMDAVNYYEAVVSLMGGLDATRSFARLFMAPGWGHCYMGGYGPGPAALDAVIAIDRWVDDGAAPGTAANPLLATGGVPARTRPLCPYPEVARWDGQGHIDASAGFMCVPPVAVRIAPKCLNLDSPGLFTAFITLPEGYRARDWGIGQLQCEGAPAVKEMLCGDGRTCIAQFERKALKHLSAGPAVRLTVTGAFGRDERQALLIGHDKVRIVK